MSVDTIYKLKPIGEIYSPFGMYLKPPKQGKGSEEILEIELFKEYKTGLEEIDKYSKLIVLYWLHKADRDALIVSKSGEAVGVFATRSPNRPNPIGLSVVDLVSRRGRLLKVRGLDAIDGTPVLDIKPYIAELDFGLQRNDGVSK